MMRCRVLLFARARDLAGVDQVTVELPAGARVMDVRRALVEACPALAALAERSAVAVDGEFAGAEVAIRESAEIALLPPVSGG